MIVVKEELLEGDGAENGGGDLMANHRHQKSMTKLSALEKEEEDDEDEEKEGGEQGGIEKCQQNGTVPIKSEKDGGEIVGTKAVAAKAVKEEPDEVVAEAGIVLLPSAWSTSANGGRGSVGGAPGGGGGLISFDRLQFSAGTAAMARKALQLNGACGDFGAPPPVVEMKRSVKRLQIKCPQSNSMQFSSFPSKGGVGGKGGGGKPGGGGAGADGAPFLTGDAYSLEGAGNQTVVGFFKEGRLFLLPIQNIYDMRLHVVGTKEKAAEKADAKKQDAERLEAELSVGTDSPNPASMGPLKRGGPAAQVLRAKFEKRETEAQKRRRESSAQHKQRLIRDDPWVGLDVEKKHPADHFKQVIEQVVRGPSSSTGMPMPTAGGGGPFENGGAGNPQNFSSTHHQTEDRKPDLASLGSAGKRPRMNGHR